MMVEYLNDEENKIYNVTKIVKSGAKSGLVRVDKWLAGRKVRIFYDSRNVVYERVVPKSQVITFPLCFIGERVRIKIK